MSASEGTPPPADTPLGERKLVTLLGLQALVFALAGLGLWWASGRPPQAFLTFAPAGIAIGLAVSAVLIVLGLLLFVGLPRTGDYLVRAQAPTLDLLPKDLSFSAIVAISFFAGAGEEMLFRGGLQTLLGDYVVIPLAIGISSALFALSHAAKPIIMALVFVVGIMFGVVFWQTGSLLGVIVGHFLYDVFALWYVLRRMGRLDVEDAAPG